MEPGNRLISSFLLSTPEPSSNIGVKEVGTGLEKVMRLNKQHVC